MHLLALPPPPQKQQQQCCWLQHREPCQLLPWLFACLTTLVLVVQQLRLAHSCRLLLLLLAAAAGWSAVQASGPESVQLPTLWN